MLIRRFSLLFFVVAMFLMPTTSFGWVKFYESEHRIDAKPEDTQIHVEYRFANKGDKPVKILSLESSCGCTTPKLDKKIYEPGERGRIKVTFDIGTREGWQQKTITVKTDDPKTPLKVLKLTVNIPVIARFGPKTLQWTTDKKSGPRILRFSGKPDLEIKVVELDYDHAVLQVKELPTERENDRTWAVLPKDLSKATQSTLRIKTNFPATAPKEYIVVVKVTKKTPVPGSAHGNATTQPAPGTPGSPGSPRAAKKALKSQNPMAQWMHKVFTGSDEIPLRLDQRMVMFAPYAGPQIRYVSGVVQTADPIEIQRVEVKGLDYCKAELMPLDWDGYFLIKFTMQEKPKETKADKTAEGKATPSQAASSQPAKKNAKQVMPKRGKILIYTNPPAPVPTPVYGFVHQPQFPMHQQHKHETQNSP